jgi:hypothetical protein
MLWYLHCCSMDNPPVGDDYDPTYKVEEVKEYLEEQYNQLFIAAQQLSLDETLICAFRRIKFKVRIVTKAGCKVRGQTLCDHRCSHSNCSEGCNLHQENYLQHFGSTRKEEDSASCGAVGGPICWNIPNNLCQSVLHVCGFDEVVD